MDFALNDDQQALVELARKIMADHCHNDALQKFASSGAAYDPVLWRTLAETGLTGVGIPQEAQGTGFGMIETAFLLEAAGSALAPVPLRDTLIGARVLADAHEQAVWVAKAVNGDLIIANAVDTTGAIDHAPPCTAQRAGEGWTLSGVCTAVPYGLEAGLIIVAARLADSKEAALFAVPADAPGMTRHAQQGTDLTPLAELQFNQVTLAKTAYLGGAAQLARHCARLRVALAASQLGVVADALRRTASYTSERIQFGRPIGSMQAVQQRAADAYIQVEALRSTVWRAAWLIDQDIYDEAEIATAKYWAALAGHTVTHTAQHQHGGMGADITYPIHRYFLAARHIESALGGAQPMLAAIGAAVAAGRARRLSAIGGGHDAV